MMTVRCPLSRRPSSGVHADAEVFTLPHHRLGLEPDRALAAQESFVSGDGGAVMFAAGLGLFVHQLIEIVLVDEALAVRGDEAIAQIAPEVADGVVIAAAADLTNQGEPRAADPGDEVHEVGERDLGHQCSLLWGFEAQAEHGMT
ncbi:MAG: hypothetical protein IPN01_16860 [Deltaproteobacteria bacterium]|nr:hypothetical protein [Deltaproteobacteria bacterium]